MRITSHVSRLLVVFFLSSSVAVFAQTNNWTLATGGNWNDTANWSLGSVPNATDTAIGIDLNNNQTIDLQTGTYTIGSLTSKGTTNTTTISNGTLKLKTSSGTPELIITKATSITAILDAAAVKKSGTGNLTLARTYFEGASALEITQGIVTFNTNINDATFDIQTGINIASGASLYSRGGARATMNWNGTLAGAGSFNLADGYGVHILNMGANGFSGMVSASGGTKIIKLARDDAFGVDSTLKVFNDQTITSSGTQNRTLHSSLTISTAGALSDNQFGNAVDSGNLTFTGGMELKRNVVNNLTIDTIVMEVQGKITDDGHTSSLGFVKLGTGTLILSGSGSNYAKDTVVSGGTMLINGVVDTPRTGSYTFTVKDSAILGGKGSITDRAVTIEAGGILAPGDSTKVNTTGTLTVNSDVTFAAGAIFRLELNSDTAYDKIVMGSVYDLTFNGLGATLDLHLNNQFDFLENMEFIIAEGFGNLTGQFAGINEDDIFTRDGVAFKMNYLSDSIKLTVVPEPSILALIGLVLTGALVFRRRGQ